MSTPESTHRSHTRAVYVISVAAELAGMHPQTLRIYERRGLVTPARTDGGNRRYSDADIAILKRISELTDEGMNLEGIRRVMHLEIENARLRAELDQGDLKALASADALRALSGHRRQQVWDASALKPAPPLLKSVPVEEDWLELPAASEGEEVVFDYAATGMSLRRHPMALLREQLAGMKLLTAAQMHDLPDGWPVRACGLVVMRQQPQTAKGVVFVTLEDETGSVNVIVWKSLREQQRSALLYSRLLAVYGVWQRDAETGGQVRHLIAKRLKDLTPLLGGLSTRSREFH